MYMYLDTTHVSLIQWTTSYATFETIYLVFFLTWHFLSIFNASWSQ